MSISSGTDKLLAFGELPPLGEFTAFGELPPLGELPGLGEFTAFGELEAILSDQWINAQTKDIWRT